MYRKSNNGSPQRAPQRAPQAAGREPAAPLERVRTRRAYFDCRFGQLHVRTAFPATGGFDEQVTLFCLHAQRRSSRDFARFLPQVADLRSAYAPDLPGCGESDPSPGSSATEAAEAMSDLADDLRLRQIDVLGVQAGAAAAMALAHTRPELVRRLVLAGLPDADGLAALRQRALVLQSRAKATPKHAHVAVVAVANDGDDLFEAESLSLARHIGTFLAAQ